MQIDERFLADFLWHITFVILFVFTIISSLITVFSKEKTYLYYSLYTFFLLTYILLKIPYLEILNYFRSFIPGAYNFYSQTLFYSFYIYFFLYFLDIESYFPVLTRRLKILLFWVIIISSIVFLIAVITEDTWFFNYYYFYVYVPFNLVMGIMAIYKASKIPGNLKYYFVTGSVVYLGLAILALVLSFNDYNWKNPIFIFDRPFYLVPLVFFYVGIFVEQIAFSLGLSYRVKKINDLLQDQFEKNKLINKQLNKSLEQRNTEIIQLTKEAKEKQLAQIKSEYDSQINKLQLGLLHNQMNPHFIFNALNSIKVYLIDNDKQKAVYYLNKFSKLIRKILESSRAESVSLEEELDLIKLYVGIEQIRFDDTIHINFEIPYDIALSQIKIPPLMLQPFVENAIWHGLSTLEKEKKLCFKAKNTSRGLELSIIDNGIGRKATQMSNMQKTIKKKSLGLKINQERLDFFNKKENLNYQFKITDLKDNNNKASGTEVRFMFYAN